MKNCLTHLFDEINIKLNGTRNQTIEINKPSGQSYRRVNFQ